MTDEEWAVIHDIAKKLFEHAYPLKTTLHHSLGTGWDENPYQNVWRELANVAIQTSLGRDVPVFLQRRDPAIANMSQTDIVAEMQTDSKLNKARRAFYHWGAKIEQAQAQRKPISIIEVRRMEFLAAEEIGKILADPSGD